MSLELDLYDKEILRFLLSKGAAASTNEISSSINVSWRTVTTHLAKLQEMKLVCCVGKGKATLWEVDHL